MTDSPTSTALMSPAYAPSALLPPGLASLTGGRPKLAGASRDVSLIAELNDLLQLDYDAVGAYTLAIASVRDRGLRDSLIRYRGDHERHITELVELIKRRNGIPVRLPHFPTGMFKLLVQAGGIAGGDRTILLAFVANEAQVDEKYRRHAKADHPADVAEVLERASLDEATHHAWGWDALNRRGIGRGTIAGASTEAFATFHGGTADVIEAVNRFGLEMMARVRNAF